MYITCLLFSIAFALKAMDEIPKECLFSPKVLTLTDLPIATGGYSTITFHKCSEKNFIVAQKTVAITQNFNDTIKSEFIYPYHLKYPTILRPFGVMDPKLNGYKVQILSRYMPGGTVWEMIQKERHKTAPLMWDGTRKSIVFYGIVKAIDFVNKQHFLHLDVKSDNVILDSNLEPYLMDFTLLSPQKDKGMKLMDQGNPIFQAPEAKNKQFDVENDWYGLGLLRYQMETLDNPFHDLPTQALWYAKETGKKFSQNTTSLTSQLMNPDPKKRPSPELVASLMEKHLFLFDHTDTDAFDRYVHELRLKEQYIFSEEMTKEERITAANNGIATAQYLAFHDTNDISYLIKAAKQNSILAKTELKELILDGHITDMNITEALNIPSFFTNEKSQFLSMNDSYDVDVGSSYDLASEAIDASLFLKYQKLQPKKGDGLLLFLRANCIQEDFALDPYELASMYYDAYRCGCIAAASKLIDMMEQKILEVDLQFILEAANNHSIHALIWLIDSNMKGENLAQNNEGAIDALQKLIDYLGYPLQRQFLAEFLYKTGRIVDALTVLLSTTERNAAEDFILSCILKEGEYIASDYFESINLTIASAEKGCTDAIQSLLKECPSSLLSLWRKESKLKKLFRNIDAYLVNM